MSQAGILKPSGGGGGGIVTINGDTGSITGSTVTIYSNNAAQNCGSSVEFINSGTVSTLNLSDPSGNTILGLGCGNASVGGTANNCVGVDCFVNLDGGSNNNVMGSASAFALTTGSSNTAIGHSAMENCTTSSENVAVGQICLQDAGVGGNNTAVGFSALGSKCDSFNTAIGNGAGFAYSTGTERSNILLANVGINGESNTMHLGTTGTGDGEVSTTYIAGINGVSVGTSLPVVINSSGQLGTSASLIQSNTVTLTPDDLDNLLETPIVIVPNQGPNTFVQVMFITGVYNYVAPDYDQNDGGDFVFYINNTSDYTFTTISWGGLLGNGVSKITNGFGAFNGNFLNLSDAVDMPVLVGNDGSQDYSGGNGTLTFTTIYTVIPTA